MNDNKDRLNNTLSNRKDMILMKIPRNQLKI